MYLSHIPEIRSVKQYPYPTVEGGGRGPTPTAARAYGRDITGV